MAALPEMDPTIVDENVLAPAIVCAVVKSTKFCVAEPVPPLAIGKIPVTPVVKGKPVALVKTPDAGVHRAGAVKDLLVNVWVPVKVTKFPDAFTSAHEATPFASDVKYFPAAAPVGNIKAGIRTWP